MREKFTVNRVQFCADTDPRTDTLYVKSIHPYDETEYHWARQGVTGCTWFIYRDGKRISAIGGCLTKEEIAAKLLNLDHAAHLTRRGGIW